VPWNCPKSLWVVVGGWLTVNLVLGFGPNQASGLWLRLGPSQTIGKNIFSLCNRVNGMRRKIIKMEKNKNKWHFLVSISMLSKVFKVDNCLNVTKEGKSELHALSDVYYIF
jgi:hypothetical protein